MLSTVTRKNKMTQPAHIPHETQSPTTPRKGASRPLVHTSCVRRECSDTEGLRKKHSAHQEFSTTTLPWHSGHLPRGNKHQCDNPSDPRETQYPATPRKATRRTPVHTPRVHRGCFGRPRGVHRGSSGDTSGRGTTDQSFCCRRWFSLLSSMLKTNSRWREAPRLLVTYKGYSTNIKINREQYLFLPAL